MAFLEQLLVEQPSSNAASGHKQANLNGSDWSDKAHK